MARCLVQVSRASSYTSALRRLKILVDGEMVAKIASGATVEFYVAPGDHVFIATADWSRTPELLVHTEESETTRLECGVAVGFPESIVSSIFRPGELYYLRVAA